MKKALLAIGGNPPPKEFLYFDHGENLSEAFDFIVAADSGLEILHAWGLMPNYITGDMDSLRNKALLETVYRDVPQDIYPVEKDQTDTQLGLAILAERGYTDISMVGGGGGRFSHGLGLVDLCRDQEGGPARPRPKRWYTDTAQMYIVPAGESFTCVRPVYTYISIYALSTEVSGIRSRGLRWPLEGHRLSHKFYSLSNHSIEPEVFLQAQRGDMLVIVELR